MGNGDISFNLATKLKISNQNMRRVRINHDSFLAELDLLEYESDIFVITEVCVSYIQV